MERPIAILGMGAILPGANNVQEFWNLLIENRCVIGEVPDSILDRSLYYDEKKGVRSKTYLSLGGTIHYPPFNYSNARFPHNLSSAVDTGSLMMVQAAADAMRQAGINPFDNPYRNTGVYLGNTLTGSLEGKLCYASVVSEAAQYLNELGSYRRAAGMHHHDIIDTVLTNIRSNLPQQHAKGQAAPSYGVANAVSDSLNCNGPSFVLDAACSSSLKAIAMAVQDIRLGKIEAAIAGGCSFFSVGTLMIFSAAQSGSLKGSVPFSDNADGLVSAEGYAAVVLKDLERALKDGDNIQAVITGIGVSSDGRGTSFWAPRKEGQILAIRRAYRNEEDMSRLDYIEAHATSTALGDATEMEALQEAFQGRFHEKIPIGGVKANIGHALEVAGVSGLIKTVMMLQKKTVPAQINFEPLNRHIDWDKFPFYVPAHNQLLQQRRDGKPLRAGVNSFGVGGLNVHILVEEWMPSYSYTSEKCTESPSLHTKVHTEKYVTEPIAVIGIGAVLPGANTAKAFADMVFSGNDPSSEMDGNRGGFLTGWQYDWKKHKIPPKSISTANPLQFMILDSVDAAIVDAGYAKLPSTAAKVSASAKYLPTEGTAAIVGSFFGTDFAAQLEMGHRLQHFKRELSKVLHQYGITDEAQIAEICREFDDYFIKKMPAIVDETCSFTPSSLCSRITKTYHFMGGAATVDSGHTVSLAALDQAVNALRAGTCDVMICVSGSRSMGLQTFNGLKLDEKFAGNGNRNTFDEHSEGTIPAEGAGTLILKRLCDAKRDGDDVKFIIHGIGAGFNADPEMAFAQAIERCWQETARTSHCTKEDISFVECSTAQKKIAVAELDAIRQCYVTEKRSQPLFVDKADSQFGNALGASGLISILKADAELQRCEMPKSFGLKKPDVKLLRTSPNLPSPPYVDISVPSDNVPLVANNEHLRLFAAVSSWDPLGSAYHAVIERGKPVEAKKKTAVATEQPRAVGYRIIRLEADSKTLMMNEIDSALETAESVFASASGNENPFAPHKFTKQYRLGLVALDVMELHDKLNLAKKFGFGEYNGILATKGIFIGTPFGSPKTAFLFSGQGSQYAGMLKSLVGHYKPARKILDEINGDLRELGQPEFEELAWDNTNSLGKDVYQTQLSLLCADTLLYRTLGTLGVKPSVVAGHSYGEYPALTASGAWSFREAVRATKIRCDTIGNCKNAEGAMLSTNWDETSALKACHYVKRGVYVANINAPDQTVLGGTLGAISEAERYIKEQGGLAKVIPVPRPFHTELMAEVRQPLYKMLGEVNTGTPSIPLLSGITNSFVSAPEEIRQNLADQMTRPVRYIDLVNSLKNSGVNIFVECGPNQVLTQFNKKILDDDSLMILPSDSKINDGLLPLLYVRACFDVFGINEDTDGVTIPKWQAWGIRNHEQILQKARQLADSGGLDSRLSDSSIDNEIATEIGRGAGLFNETVTALIAASGSIENFQKEIENGDHKVISTLLPNDAVAKKAFPTITESEFAQYTETMPVEFRGKDFYRFVMRLMKKPLAAITISSSVKWNGRVLIFGKNKLAETLADKVRQSGAEVVILAANGTREEIEAKIEQYWKDGALPHLFLTTAYDSEAAGDWNKRRDSGVLLPFFATKKWYSLVLQNGLLGSASAVAAVNLGGGFGFNGDLKNPEGGAITGMIKSLNIEAGLQCEFKFIGKVIDFSGEQTDEMKAETLLIELAVCEPYSTETGYIGAERFLVRPVPKPTSGIDAVSPSPSGHWVITGGGRGITAYVAHQLARKFCLTLHILGSSPTPVISERWCNADELERGKIKQEIRAKCKASGENFAKEWKQFKRNAELSETVYAMRKDGIAVHYYQCDVSKRDEVAETLDKVRQAGKINGVLHGAGIEVSATFDRKDPAIVEKTLDVKCGGAINLMELTQRDVLKYFAAFGSTAGRMGSPGQCDYGAANDYLAKLCTTYHDRNPQCRVSVLEWGPWGGETGMAARPEIRNAPQFAGYDLMNPAEGVQHVIDEMTAVERTAEVMFIDWKMFRTVYPAETIDERASALAESIDAPTMPLIDRIENNAAYCTFDPATDPFLLHHRLKQRPLLPAVISIEAFLETIKIFEPAKKIISLRNLNLQNGLAFADDTPKEVKIKTEKDGNRILCRLVAPFYNSKGKLVIPEKTYSSCSAEIADNVVPLSETLPPLPQGEWKKIEYSPKGASMYHGPVFQQAVEALFTEKDGIWCRLLARPLAALAGTRGAAGWQIHPATIDALMFVCGVGIWWSHSGAIGLPAAIGTLHFGRLPKLDENMTAHVVWTRTEKYNIFFDAVCCGENGDMLYAMNDFCAYVVPNVSIHRAELMKQ